MMRAALFAMLLAYAGTAVGQGQPQAQHMQAYRERLAFYQASGFDTVETLKRMKDYFPGFGVRFGIEVDRAGRQHYYVAIGSGVEMTFYALLEP